MRFSKNLAVLLWAGSCLAQAQPQIDWVNQVKNKPSFDPRQYNFAPQKPGGSLSPGSCSFSLNPLPAGVTSGGSLYLSGGTGAAETVPISSLVGNTVNAICANSHSLAWTVQSATAGIWEAVHAAAAAGGGAVVIAPGTYTVRATTTVPSKVRLIGAGREATTIVASGASANSWWWASNTEYGVITASSADSIEVASMTIDLGTPSMTLSGFASVGLTNSYIHDLAVRNPWQGGLHTMINTASVVPSSNNVIEGNFVYMGSGCTDNNGPGAINLNNTFRTRVVNNYAEGGCASSYISANAPNSGNVFSGNVFRLASGTMSAGNQAYSADSSGGVVFTGNVCIGNGTGPACFTNTADGGPSAPDPNDVTFVGNFAYNCGFGFLINGAATGHTAHGTVIDGNVVNGCAVGVLVEPGSPYPGNIDHTTISNNVIDSSGTFGIHLLSQTAGATITGTVIKGNQIRNNGSSGIQLRQTFPNLITYTVISENTINHNNPAGILINPSAGNPIFDGTISNNIILDTGGGVVQQYAIFFNTADTYGQWVITGNNFNTQLGVQWPNSNSISSMSNSYIGGNMCSGPCAANGLPNGVIYSSGTSFASLGTCAINNSGAYATVTDSAVNTWGTTITGGGANRVMAFCNGSSWTVAGK